MKKHLCCPVCGEPLTISRGLNPKVVAKLIKLNHPSLAAWPPFAYCTARLCPCERTGYHEYGPTPDKAARNFQRAFVKRCPRYRYLKKCPPRCLAQKAVASGNLNKASAHCTRASKRNCKNQLSHLKTTKP
jgi:hypothetical protein